MNRQGVRIDNNGEFIVDDAKPFIDKDGKQEFICQPQLKKDKGKKVVKKKGKSKKKRRATIKK